MRATTCLRVSIGMSLLALAATATAQNAMTTDSADVYAGPDSSYPPVAQLDPDTPIQVVGCLDDYSWCDVGFDGNRGWLYSPDITYQYQGGYVPLYAYAPGLGVPVVAFSFDAYWGSYYHDRPFFQQREQWAHRTVHHQRPPGPRPSSGPPPREAVRNIRPHQGPQADHGDGVRLGRAERPDPRQQERAPAPGPRPEMNARPSGSAAPQRNAEPQHRPEPQHNAEPPRNAEPQHAPAHEESPRAGARIEAQPRVEPQHSEPQHRAEPPHAPEKPEPPKS